MNIALIGASGNVGSRIQAELVRRGHRVTAIARNTDTIVAGPAVTVRRGDVSDVEGMARLLEGHDAAVSAVKFLAGDPDALIAAVKASGVPRYLVVGGAGSLEAAPGLRVIDTPDFPEAYKAEAGKGAAFLERLRGEADLDWTFLSPSALFVPGERTGRFRLGTDRLLVDGAGNSSISYEDYAVALVDELEAPKHRRARFTVGY